jgi:quercetin dioxygenase-like cupin family protein
MIRKPGEGEMWRTPFGDTVTWLVGEEGTGGSYALLERVAPVGARSEPHAHKRIEAFYVTDGEFELTLGDHTTRGGAGTLVVAAEGESHGWAAVGDRPARMMILLSPSPPQAYYRELDALVRSFGDNPPDVRAMIELSQRHGIGLLRRAHS